MFYASSGPERRLWLDEQERRCAIVDESDYDYFSRWLWTAKPSLGFRKYYAFRPVTSQTNGVRVVSSAYLHVEIMRRSGVSPPTFAHVVVDHRNGDSLLCARLNLRWATRSQNARNRYGREPRDIADEAMVAIGDDHNGQRVDFPGDGDCPF